MATEVGQLVLKVDTSQVKAAESAVERLGVESEKTGKRTKEMTRTIDSSQRSMREQAAAIDTAAAETRDMAVALDHLADEAQDAAAATQMAAEQARRMPKAANDAGGAVGDFGRKAAMAGVQFEQMAGQIAMGQNPLRAIGVQAADLGFVLGVPLLGAVVGIGAAIGSVLIPMLSEAEKSTEELEESLTDIARVMSTRAVDGAEILSESFMKLARSSRQLAEIELRVKMIEAMENVTAAQAALIASTEELRVKQHQFGQNARANPRILREFSEEMGISQERALALRDAIDGMRAGNEGAQDSFIELVRSALETENVTPAFASLAKEVLQAALMMSTAEDQAEFLRTTLANLDESLRTSGEEFQTHSEVSAEAAEKMVERIIAANDTQIEAIERRERENLQIVNDLLAKERITREMHEQAVAEILETGRTARQDLETSQAEERIARIMDENDREMQILIENERKKKEMAAQTTSALLAFEDVLLKGKSEKQKAGFRLAVNLANAEKRENAKNIISNSYDAAMKAYKALAGIPFVGPALGAAAAGVIIAAGASYAAQSLSGRALGGQVRAGESYVVGERGPEVLTMGTGGRITPNEALGGGGQKVVNRTANVSFNIQANDTQGFDELLARRRGQIIQIINEALNDNGQVALV